MIDIPGCSELTNLFQTICFGCRKKDDKNISTLNTNDLDMFEASQLTSKSSSNTQGNV